MQNVLGDKASVPQLKLWLQCCHNTLNKSYLGEVPPLALQRTSVTTRIAASDTARHSASLTESTTIACLELFQQITPPFRVNTKPKIPLLLPLSD